MEKQLPKPKPKENLYDLLNRYKTYGNIASIRDGFVFLDGWAFGYSDAYNIMKRVLEVGHY